MKNYYPQIKRASKSHKKKLIKEININEPIEFPEVCIERQITKKQMDNIIYTIYR